MSDAYFGQMTQALREADINQPCLVLDRDRLDGNITRVMAGFPQGAALRLVDKSLPSLPLMARIRQAFGTDRLMTFHAPVTEAVLSESPDVELLCGKPLPVALARQLLMGKQGKAAERIVWLIDTPGRLAQYGALAEELDRALRFCFEIDVGLHRGGFANPEAVASVLPALTKHSRLTCVGVMAYEAHIGHVPWLLGGAEGARKRSLGLFQQFVAVLAPEQRRILNLGGSSTALTYDTETGANEFSVGSAFVKPTDFDVPSLRVLEPAIFIAAPVLKVVDVQLPGLDAKSRIAQKLGLLPRKACFLYGGKWMAKPVFPAGMKTNSTFGFSTNQQFFALPNDTSLTIDDYAFLRPTQSEFVLQQFGSIRVMAGGRIVEDWPAIPLQ